MHGLVVSFSPLLFSFSPLFSVLQPQCYCRAGQKKIIGVTKQVFGLIRTFKVKRKLLTFLTRTAHKLYNTKQLGLLLYNYFQQKQAAPKSYPSPEYLKSLTDSLPNQKTS